MDSKSNKEGIKNSVNDASSPETKKITESVEKEGYVIATGTALKKGGSLQLTIPKDVVEVLDLEAGDMIMFVYDSSKKQIVMNKVEILTNPRGLSFSISKEQARKILRDKGKIENA